ncbi:hypothetical protein GPX89_27030 [Nocardia sp. ET3-3]|uniref:Uncharacterized protein n=1 Tax=Nocardia terrae TaxID=2675851 RepID=A0A7K1V2X2_9NOCA|nr:hypothetical protein [Nocardia terrae]MVU80891.1 hypothetical protein [Nocardia terrae]
MLFELVGAHLQGDAAGVSAVAGQIERFGRLREVLTEANFYGEYLAGCHDRSGDPVSAEFIGAGIRARLASVLPPDEELAALDALEHWTVHGSGRAAEAFGNEALLLQVMAAGIAELGTRVFGGDFTSDQLVSIPRG